MPADVGALNEAPVRRLVRTIILMQIDELHLQPRHWIVAIAAKPPAFTQMAA